LNRQKLTRPTWDEYFIEIAQVVSKRSTCLRRCYGAVIVKDNVIVSTGYNGSPRGEANCIDTGKCVREELNVPKGERYELCAGVHSEQNSIINGDPVKMKGATIYIAGFNADGTLASGEPCLLCRRMIKNAMIERVVYLDDDGIIKEYK
jgi:dCMP deaminase